MQAGGGGGGFAFGYMAAKHPEAAGAGVLLVAAGMGIYGICYAIDAPQREPFAVEIVEESLTHCANAASNPALYETDLKERLLATWSSTLEEISNHENLIICMDDDLNNFTLPYEIKTMNEAGELAERHWGERRVTGVVYQNGYGGSTVLVVKPDSDRIPATSTDLSPDRPHSIAKVYNAFIENGERARDVVLPYTNMHVSVIMQQDGVSQKAGVSKPKDDDGVRWATPESFEEIAEHYEFDYPA